MSTLEERLRAADARIPGTRAAFYRGLIEWAFPLQGTLPAQRLFLGVVDRPESTFRDHFSEEKHPTLQPCECRLLAGMERAVMEVKTLSLDPFVRAHREASARLALGHRADLESLVVAVVTWALRFRAVAQMLPTAMPDSVDRAVARLAGGGAVGAARRDAIHQLLADAAAAAVAAPPDATPGEVVTGLRAGIAELFPADDELLEAARRLVSHIGDFMLMSAGSGSHSDPQLRFVLDRALRSLRGGQAGPHGTPQEVS